MPISPRHPSLTLATACFLQASFVHAQNDQRELSIPICKAVAYLAREVPRWSPENGCYSCHHNGDAARALYTAKAAGYPFGQKSLDDTTAWLRLPQRWDDNKGDEAASDKVLARIQFSASLMTAFETKAINDPAALHHAAQRLAADQQNDGAWPIDAAGSIGSPVTYGSVLATLTARRTLERIDPKKYRDPIAKANHWLRRRRPNNVLDTAALLMAVPFNPTPDTNDIQTRCLKFLIEAEATDGGWGPYKLTAPEPFDTAVALFALQPYRDRDHIAGLSDRGRAFLVGSQLNDGSWPETTRPPNAESYAQRLSTTAWATRALIATEPPSSPPAHQPNSTPANPSKSPPTP
jgi:hypothetical protein